MKKQDWDNIQEAEAFKRPAPGGYVVRITEIQDVEEKEYLRVDWDFAEGEFHGYYAQLYAAKGFWGGVFIKSYKPKALPYFKAFKTCLETSNRGYIFREDRLDDLRGKVFGIVLGEEEYRKNDGSVGKRLYVHQARSVKSIRDGDFTVPELKKLPASQTPPASGGFYPVSDDGELPF